MPMWPFIEPRMKEETGWSGSHRICGNKKNIKELTKNEHLLPLHPAFGHLHPQGEGLNGNCAPNHDTLYKVAGQPPPKALNKATRLVETVRLDWARASSAA